MGLTGRFDRCLDGTGGFARHSRRITCRTNSAAYRTGRRNLRGKRLVLDFEIFAQSDGGYQRLSVRNGTGLRGGGSDGRLVLPILPGMADLVQHVINHFVHGVDLLLRRLRWHLYVQFKLF